MKKNRFPLVSAIVLMILFFVLLIFSIIGGLFNLGLLSVVAVLSVLLFFVNTIQNFSLAKQNLSVGICFFLLALADLIIYFHDTPHDKSRLFIFAVFVVLGSILLYRSKHPVKIK
jgi:uncharacterized membrane protein YedE/YeeE